MAISSDYSSPVTVNGFSCRNCAEVDKAKRHIDPANPAGGPFGLNNHSKTAPAKNHFSAEARPQNLMEALHQARAKPATNPAAAAYNAGGGGGLGGVAGQFVAISA